MPVASAPAPPPDLAAHRRSSPELAEAAHDSFYPCPRPSSSSSVPPSSHGQSVSSPSTPPPLAALCPTPVAALLHCRRRELPQPTVAAPVPCQTRRRRNRLPLLPVMPEPPPAAGHCKSLELGETSLLQDSSHCRPSFFPCPCRSPCPPSALPPSISPKSPRPLPLPDKPTASLFVHPQCRATLCLAPPPCRDPVPCRLQAETPLGHGRSAHLHPVPVLCRV